METLTCVTKVKCTLNIKSFQTAWQHAITDKSMSIYFLIITCMYVCFCQYVISTRRLILFCLHYIRCRIWKWDCLIVGSPPVPFQLSWLFLSCQIQNESWVMVQGPPLHPWVCPMLPILHTHSRLQRDRHQDKTQALSHVRGHRWQQLVRNETHLYQPRGTLGRNYSAAQCLVLATVVKSNLLNKVIDNLKYWLFRVLPFLNCQA